MERGDFYYQKCIELASTSQDVHFVGVVDNHGKLVAGQENRKNGKGYVNLIEGRSPRPKLKFPIVILQYIVQAIKDIRHSLAVDIDHSHLNIQVSAYDFDESSLIVLPLNIRGDIFLCIYGNPKCLEDDSILNYVENF